MLPASARLRAAEDFRGTVRRGVRVGRPTLVMHTRPSEAPASRAGFVVSKAVGNAVTRNRVKRRLRHLAAAALPSATRPLDVVVRALPPAADATARLAEDFASAWATTQEKVEAR